MKGKRTILATKKVIKRLMNGAARVALVMHGEAPRVAIVSCDLWRGKVYDDLLLQGELIRYGINAEVVSWQDIKVEWGNFDALVIGSMWGYQNFLKDFEKWLDMVEKATVVINSTNVIRENYNKAKQFSTLKKAEVPIVETQIIKPGELGRATLPKGKFVVKPAISGGGENTFLIKDSNEFKKLHDKLTFINREQELLIQPFVAEICNGELGIVIINGEVVNSVRRFPGVLEGDFGVQLLNKDKLSTPVKVLAQKVANLPEYRDAVYLRIDIVERANGLAVMEVEALEPQLYYYLLKGTLRKEMLRKMATAVKSVLSEEKASAIH